MSTAVKRACDACHRRKVKCDGINPCRNCASAQLTCTYNAVPQKKGPKGSRAKVISELRETQRQTSLSAKIQNRLNGVANPPCTSSLSPTPGLLTSEMAKESVEFYFANMYSIFPIFNRQKLEQQALFVDQNLDTYCLLASLCAFMTLQPGMMMPGLDPVLEHMPGTNMISATLLMEEATRVRKGHDYIDVPSLDSVCTSYLLFSCYYALELHDKAWFHLREATTLTHLMGMASEETYSSLDSTESSRRRRLYWLLLVAERAYALERGRPLTLGSSIRPPNMADDPADPHAHQLNSFVHLVTLYQSFDDTFNTFWNKARGECSASYLGALQKQLSHANSSYMNNQDQDLQMNQQWLKQVSWHLKAQNDRSSQTNEDQMSLHYSTDASRDLVYSITSQLSTQGTEVLGVPLVAKLLDISCILADFLAMQPSSGSIFGTGPREQLPSLLQLLSALRNGEHHLVPLLIHKVHSIVPRLASPLLQRAPDTAPCTMDIFDGFGSAGMAQPSLITDFKAEPFTPSGVQHMEEMVPEPHSSNTAQPPASLSSPFPMGNSPSMVSPGEYPHMGEFNSIPDMMSPVNHAPQSSLTQQGSMSHPPPHLSQHRNVPPHSMAQNHGLGNHISSTMHNGISHGMAHSQNLAGMNQQSTIAPDQGFTQHSQGLVSGVIHRQTPQRANSFAIHQQPQVNRSVADFHTLQQGASENVPMNALGLGTISAEMDFGAL